MANLEIEGQLYQGGSAKFSEHIINFNQTGNIELALSSDLSDVKSFHLSELTVSDKLGNTPRQICFSNGDVFSFISTAELDLWFKQHGHFSKLDKIEKSKLFILASLVFAPIFIYGIFVHAIPAFAIQFAHLVPDSVVDISSRHTLVMLDKTMLDESKIPAHDQQAYLEQWYAGIDDLMGKSGDLNKYDIQFRASDEMGANAFALPNGTIVITDDLIALLEKHPDALFSILLHEIGHVEQDHSMRFIAESLVSTLVINYIFGDLTGAVDLFLGTGSTIVSNQFSQKLEWEADNYAIDLLISNDHSVEGFAKAMEAFLAEHSESDIDKLLSSHPLLAERAQHARDRQKQAQKP